MELTTKKFNSLNDEFKELYIESFPEGERMEYSLLTKMLEDSKNSLVNYYDEGKFIGFTINLVYEHFCCLLFFATDSRYRNQGYGKRILDVYFKENQSKTVFLSCEIPDASNNEDIKYRRLSFYKRNGFIVTPLITMYKNIEYLTIVNKEISNDELEELHQLFLSFKCPCRFE